MILDQLFESQTLAEEFGSRYAEQLAQRLYDEHPDLDTAADENEVLDHAFALAQQELGAKRAHSLFAYDEDFAGDLLAAYSVLSQGQGVSEGQTRKAMQRTQKKDPDYCDACDRPNNRCVCESLVQEAQAVSATTVADAIFRAIKRDYADQGFTWSGDIYDFWEFLDEYEGSRFVDQYWALSQRDQRAVFAAVKQAIKQHFSSGDDVADARGRGLMTRMREQGVREGGKRHRMSQHATGIAIRQAEDRRIAHNKKIYAMMRDIATKDMRPEDKAAAIDALQQQVIREQGVSEGYPYGQHKPKKGECPECGTVGGHEDDCSRHPDNKKPGVSEGVNVKQIKKDIDSGMSLDAVIGKHANRRLTNTDEIRRVIQQHAWEKRKNKTKEQGVAEARYFKTSYGWAGGSKPSGGTYKHPEQIKADREAKKKAKEKQKNKPQGVAEAIPAHIKPSDIPPAMRNRRLTMKDIEAERPQGAYRYRVGEKEFMDLSAAKQFAAGTGQKVEPIRETKKMSAKDDPCWKGYHMVGTKRKGGREVPNCVPGKKGATNESLRIDAEQAALSKFKSSDHPSFQTFVESWYRAHGGI